MNPIVHVLYMTEYGDVRFEERSVLGNMSSTNPADYNLPESATVFAVFFKFQALETYIDGVRRDA